MTNPNGTIFILQGSQKKKKKTERKGIETVFEEVIAENFSNLGKEIVSQALDIHRSPNKREPRKTTPKHIIIKMAKIKDKDRLLNTARERNKMTYKGKPTTALALFTM